MLPKMELFEAGAPKGFAAVPPVVLDGVPKLNPPAPPPNGFAAGAAPAAGIPKALLAVLKPKVGGPASPAGLGP